PDSALSISTFTFASGRETPPQIVSVTATDNPCALTLSWTPAYDTTRVRGFLVFRSTSPAGQYFQLEGVQKANQFADPSVARNTTYFYRVVAQRRDGMLSSMSDPKSGVHP
ncbi:MAG TPA: fibronectin type III domain-containing protein, partial [Bacteroidota bacterium]|nr:fibronectin type III domain-containing protein [Bacteroidota bacterium]